MPHINRPKGSWFPVPTTDFITTAQWSETSIGWMYCLHIGHFWNHSLDTNTLPNILFVEPFDLYHVYFLQQ